MGTLGFNVEWSQELSVQQSLEEYVKGAMLIEILKEAGVGAGLPETVFDMSVGYDLAGVRSAKVRGFLDGMLDAGRSLTGCGTDPGRVAKVSRPAVPNPHLRTR